MNNPGSPSCTRPLAIPATWDWPKFWSAADTQLRAFGYKGGTRRLYRQVLRSFYQFTTSPTRSHRPLRFQVSNSNSSSSLSLLPYQIRREHICAYLNELRERRRSASWIGMNTAVLRMLFDRLAGGELTDGIRTPRIPRPLPRILTDRQIDLLFRQATHSRDRLLLQLLYGCGLKVGEVVRIRCEHFNQEATILHLPAIGTAPPRQIPVPTCLRNAILANRHWKTPDAFFVAARSSTRPLSVRTAEHIVRQCALRVGLAEPVTSMTLRHSFAVHALRAGMQVRVLQELLGHRCIETTLKYERCVPPANVISPLDRLERTAPEPSSLPRTTFVPDQHHQRPGMLSRLKSRLLNLRPSRSPD